MGKTEPEMKRGERAAETGGGGGGEGMKKGTEGSEPSQCSLHRRQACLAF